MRSRQPPNEVKWRQILSLRGRLVPSCNKLRATMLAMTGGAAREVPSAPDSVLSDELRPERRPVRRLPLHVEDLGARPHLLLGVAMTLQAPFHLQRCRLPHQRHPVDAAVTRG